MAQKIHSLVYKICQEFGIEIIPFTRYPEIGQTRAVGTMDRILTRYGEDHFRMVMTTLAETANNKCAVDEYGLWAASDLIRAWSHVVESRASEWLEVWDAMPVGELQFIHRGLLGITPQRHALAGTLHERLSKQFGPLSDQLDLLDDRRMGTKP